jgi:flagellar hook protein FlgE
MRAPAPSTVFQAVTNLDAGTPVGATYATAVQIYDALGAPHVLTMTYTNTGPGAWTYNLTAEGAEVAGGTPGVPSSLGTGAVAFNASGILTTPAADVVLTTPAWANGAAAGSITWDVLSGSSTTPTLTGFATTSATSSITQNGAPAGMITDISIDRSGRITATFGAGQSVVMGQLAMASFNNPQGLVKLGGNRYGESEASGLSNVGVAGTGGRGTLVGNALEQSNVDMAQEFTQMILAQRGYQANSKTITVSDQLLVDTLNLKQ